MCGWGAHSSTWGSDCVEVDLPGCSIFLSHSWIPERQKISVVSQVTVDYAKVALISWGTWPWRGTLMWCPCRGYLWHENEFNCRRLMAIMLRVWFFTAVCPHVGTEHHHTAKSLKIFDRLTTNSLNVDITQPHVHDKYNTNLLFSLLDKEHHADCSTGTKEFRFSLPGTNSK